VLELARTRAVLERGIAERWQAGAQLHVSREGERGGLALGLARPGAPMREDTLVLWFSSVKPLMSVAIGQLVERGLVGLDDPAARPLPEFAANGKDAITLRHLLTHTAGIPNAHRTWSRESWEEILAKICAAEIEPGWVVGRDCGYHVASAWYVLGEIVRRCDGRTYDRYVREAIFAPLGVDEFWVGMSAADHAAQRERIAHPYDASGGKLEPIEYWAWTGSEEAVALCRPGGSGWGTARALGRFYELLLSGGAIGDGSRVLASDTIACLTACALPGVLDRGFVTRLDRGLGFVLDSRVYGVRLVRHARVRASVRPRRLLLVGRVRRSRAPARGRAGLERRDRAGAPRGAPARDTRRSVPGPRVVVSPLDDRCGDLSR